jgi:PST family polysaccharide transporter
MWQAIVCALTFPAGFYLGTRWGITGVAAMWVMLYPLVSIPLFWRAFWRLQLPVSQYLAALWPAMSGSLLMLGVLLLLRYSLPGQWPVSVRLGIHVTVGSLSYASAFLIFHRGRARSLYQALSVLRGA